MHTGGLVLGFHGCDAAAAEEIFAGREHIAASVNTHDWLGSGAYFWENSPRRAFQWAEKVRCHPQHFQHRIQNPCVVGAIIDLGRCLDLMSAESLEMLRTSHQSLAEHFARLNLPLPINATGFSGDLDLVKRHLDCAVINFAHSLQEQQGTHIYDTVRGAFPEGRPLYAGARIMESTHVQICVRHPRQSIRGYFRPLPGV